MSRPQCVLVLEGPISVGFSQSLRQSDHYVRTVANAQQLLDESHLADLIVLDTLRPDLTLPTSRQLESQVDVPVLMIAPETPTNYSLALLRLPFDEETLHQKVKEMLVKQGAEDVVRVGDLMIDFKAQRVMRGEVRVKLSPVEFSFLAFLARRMGEAVSFEELLTGVWRYEPDMGDRNVVTTTVQRVRHKLDENPKAPKYIVSVKSVGYRLRSQEQFEEAMRQEPNL